MKKQFTVSLSMMLLTLAVCSPSAFPVGPPQPPVDAATLYVGRGGWGPSHADPVRAYDKLSQELIFNVYDTLIVFGEPVTNSWGTWDVHEQYWRFSPSLATNVPDRTTITKTITSTDVVVTDPTGSIWSDGSVCFGWVDNNPDGTLGFTDVMYLIEQDGSYRTWTVVAFSAGPPVSVTLQRYSYTFHIRTSPVINFYDYTGAIVGTFDVADAQYSFQRGLVQDQYGSPMWMFYKPFFDQMNSDGWTSSTNLANLINNAVETSGDDLTLNLGMAFPDCAFKQIIAQTWSSIVSKEWAIGKGCWNGNLFEDVNADGIPDWYVDWRHLPASPIQPIDPTNYAGTGPYHVSVALEPANLVVLQRNPGHWRGWPAPDRKAYIEHVDIEYISSWPTRREAFKACQLDICDVPRAYIAQLLDPMDPNRMDTILPEIKTIKNIAPTLSLDAMFFTFTVDPTSDAIYTGFFPDGIPANFFNNSYVRKAFAYAFNYTKYLTDVWMGEAICRETPDIYGLVPDYYCHSPDPPWTYDKNLDMVRQMLEQAMFTQYDVTRSVWDWGGFHLTMYYHVGDDQGRLACEFMQSTFNEINSLYGTNFIITVQGVYSPTFLDYMETAHMPLFVTGWQANFADADDFKRPFMHSQGYFALFQNYTADNSWTTTPGPRTGLTKDLLIDLATKTPDGPEREELYKDLDDIYLADCPSLPIAQPSGRRWQKSWVKGWYYNALYPSDYYYHLYKEDTPWADVTGPIVGIPDGLVTKLDLEYVAYHNGAKAPDPARSPPYPYDDTWAPGTYGCGGCDVYGDRKVDSRDTGYVAAHGGDGTCPPEQEHGGTVDLIVVPSRETVAIDYTVDVTVKVNNVLGLTAYQTCLYYNASVLQLVNCTIAPIPGWEATINGTLSKACDGKNCIIVDCWKYPSSGSPFSGNAVLVNFTFRGIAKGNTTLSVSRSTLAADGQRILYNTVDTSVRCIATGDVNEDGICNMRDIGLCCNAFMATRDEDGNYTHKPPCQLCPHDPNTDINNDGVVNMRDIGIACSNFMKKDP